MDMVTSDKFITSGERLFGLEITVGKRHDDARGSFTEMFCKEWGLGIEPTQWSIVESAERVLRGMHLHRRHDEYFALVKGRACVGLYDARPKSPTFMKSCLIDLDDSERVFVTFPSGLIHGWYFYTPTIHLQAVSESYLNYGKDDNIRCSWADPDINIAWPDRVPVLSDLAEGAGTVQEILNLMRADS